MDELNDIFTIVLALLAVTLICAILCCAGRLICGIITEKPTPKMRMDDDIELGKTSSKLVKSRMRRIACKRRRKEIALEPKPFMETLAFLPRSCLDTVSLTSKQFWDMVKSDHFKRHSLRHFEKVTLSFDDKIDRYVAIIKRPSAAEETRISDGFEYSSLARLLRCSYVSVFDHTFPITGDFWREMEEVFPTMHVGLFHLREFDVISMQTQSYVIVMLPKFIAIDKMYFVGKFEKCGMNDDFLLTCAEIGIRTMKLPFGSPYMWQFKVTYWGIIQYCFNYYPRLNGKNRHLKVNNANISPNILGIIYREWQKEKLTVSVNLTIYPIKIEQLYVPQPMQHSMKSYPKRTVFTLTKVKRRMEITFDDRKETMHMRCANLPEGHDFFKIKALLQQPNVAPKAS